MQNLPRVEQVLACAPELCVCQGCGKETVVIGFNHYRQTELLAENKTEKTRTTYLVYLRKWILTEWGREYLHNIKPVVVEQWLRSLGELSNGSKAKIRNIMSGLFSHAIRYEMADRSPITAVRQSSKRERVPVILEVEELHRLDAPASPRKSAGTLSGTRSQL